MRAVVLKKKKSPAKAKRGHPGSAAAAANIVSIDELRAHSTGDEVTAGFMKWVRANTELLQLGDPLSVLRTFLENHGASARTSVTTVQEPFATQVALGKYVYDHPEMDFDFVLHVVVGYLLYLDDSDLWSGSDELFEEVQEALLQALDDDSDEEFDDRVFDVPALTRSQTRDALLALPLATHLQAFIAWFGNKRDVTSTGLLTRKDIQGAAAALGVAAQGVGSLPQGACPDQGAPLQVTSARQIPQLELFWDSLVRIGLVELGSRHAAMNHPLESLEGTAREDMLSLVVRDVALGLYLQFIATAATAALAAGEETDQTSLAGDLVSSILLDAGIATGIPAESLTGALAALEGADLGEAPLLDLAVGLMLGEGLLQRDTHVRVPDVLKKLVAFAVAEPAGLEINYEDPRDEDLAYLGAAD